MHGKVLMVKNQRAAEGFYEHSGRVKPMIVDTNTKALRLGESETHSPGYLELGVFCGLAPRVYVMVAAISAGQGGIRASLCRRSTVKTSQRQFWRRSKGNRCGLGQSRYYRGGYQGPGRMGRLSSFRPPGDGGRNTDH